jgi:hypothetical protein
MALIQFEPSVFSAPVSAVGRAPSLGGRVLQLSMRRAQDCVGCCPTYELEDVFASVTGGDRIEVDDAGAIKFARARAWLVHKLGRLASRSKQVASWVAPRIRAPELTRDYDLFFPVFNNPFELSALAAVPDWRRRSRAAVCFINELWRDRWPHLLPGYLLELLSGFDHVFIGVESGVGDVARIIGRPCTYLPLAADVLRFAPPPNAVRNIDVCYIGRRSAVTHTALLQRARERGSFYYHDTVRSSGKGGKQVTFGVSSPSEHRVILANLLKRTRYYVANRARVNQPEFRDQEISARFFEGIAAGAVLIGEAPRSANFLRQFDWPDALIPLPFDSPDVGAVLDALDVDPARLERIRRDNVHHAALRHDWLHRLKTVFEVAGLTPTDAMRAREARLRELCDAAPDVYAKTA